MSYCSAASAELYKDSTHGAAYRTTSDREQLKHYTQRVTRNAQRTTSDRDQCMSRSRRTSARHFAAALRACLPCSPNRLLQRCLVTAGCARRACAG